MSQDVLVVRVFGNINKTKTATKQLWIVGKLKLTTVRLVFLVGTKRKSTKLAVTHVKDPEINFWSSPFFVQTGVFNNSSVSCILFTTSCTNVAMVVCKLKIIKLYV